MNSDDLLILYTQITCTLIPMLLEDEPQPLHNSAWTGRMKTEN